MSNKEINSQIVLMRKDVKQARMHVIKKLTRTADILRKKKGTDSQKEKNERKAKKLVDEILAIKQVKLDEVTKFALTNEIPLTKTLEAQTAKPIDRIMARIAYHKKFSEKIDNFKKEYPQYQEYLEYQKNKNKYPKLPNKKLLEYQKDKIRKTVHPSELKKDKQKKSNKKTKKNIKISQSDDGSQFSDNGIEDSDVDLGDCKDNQEEGDQEVSDHEDGVSMVSDSAVDNIDKENNKSSKINSSDELDECVKLESKTRKDKVTKSMQQPGVIKQKKSKSKKISDSLEESQKSIIIPQVVSKEAVVKKFTDILKEEPSKIKNDPNSEPKKSVKKIEKTADPFFVVGNGNESYQCIAPKKPKFESKKEDDRFNDKRSFNKRTFTHTTDNNNFSKKGPFEKSIPTAKNATPESLHPSWQAKKKQQEILKQGFQGKKIVFGDD